MNCDSVQKRRLIIYGYKYLYSYNTFEWKFHVANLRASYSSSSAKLSRLNISISMVTLLPSMNLWIIVAVAPRGVWSPGGFMGLLEANQEDRVSNQRYWRAGLCWFGIMALRAILLSLLHPLSFPFHPCPYTTLSLETLYYRRQIKSVIVNTAAGVLEVIRLILRRNIVMRM